LNAVLIAAACIAEGLDLGSFYMAVNRFGIGREANPLARALHEAFGIAGPGILKAMAVVLMVLITLTIFKVYPRSIAARGLLIFAILVGGYGAFTNISALTHSDHIFKPGITLDASQVIDMRGQ
jgi:hypothetical protein